MQFTLLLSKLNSSLQSIHRLTQLTLAHPACALDLYDCLVQESTHTTINQRINLLYFIDHILLTPSPFSQRVTLNLANLINIVVPEQPHGALNLVTALHVLTVWNTKKLVPPELLQPILLSLQQRTST